MSASNPNLSCNAWKRSKLNHCSWIGEPSLSLHDPSIPVSSPACATSNSLLYRNLSSVEAGPTEHQTSQLQDLRFGNIGLLAPWFPQVDPKHPMARTWRTWHSRRNVLLITASMISVSVFITNFIIAIIVSTRYKYSEAVVILREGDCQQIKRVSTIFHIAINILSTLLLGASNLCMQLLAAPTRDEVDKAHQKGKWLDVGVPSWRNLKHISIKRQAVWWCLGISSVPLHFM